MNLSFNLIKEIVTGAVRVEEENGSVKLYRFTKEQEELYKTEHQDLYPKTLSAAGMKLLFKTDSKNLFLKIKTSQGSSRKYFSVDVFADGKAVDSLDNFSDIDMPRNYTQLELAYAEFSKEFSLGEGEKEVCVYLPWSVGVSIEELSLDDGALVEAIKPKKKLLAFGDSITQGYDALRPSNRYIARLADSLGAEEFNKAIGGEKFFPELAKLKDAFEPDYITVAYGTNDWSNMDAEIFKEKCKDFYSNITKLYHGAKVLAITPIWRKDMNGERKFGAFEDVEKHIRSAVKDMKNVMVISGLDLVPHNEKYFADLKLHPNDEGFDYYFKNLYNEIKSKI